MRCDGARPCQRCARNDTDCRYFDAVRDGNELRIERLEAEIEDLKAALHVTQMSEHSAANALAMPQQSPSVAAPVGYGSEMHESPHDHRSVVGSVGEPQWKQPSMEANAVQAGLVTWAQATCWYQR